MICSTDPSKFKSSKLLETVVSLHKWKCISFIAFIQLAKKMLQIRCDTKFHGVTYSHILCSLAVIRYNHITAV